MLIGILGTVLILGLGITLTIFAYNLCDGLVGKILSIVGGVVFSAVIAAVILGTCNERNSARNSDRTVTVYSGNTIVEYSGTGIDVKKNRSGGVEITLPDGKKYVYYNSDVECVVNEPATSD